MAMDMAGGPDMPAVHGNLPASPAPDMPHHRPAASGHHPCLAAPAAGIHLGAPAGAAPPALPHQRDPAASGVPFRARADRTPPDLDDLCVSRT